MKRIILTAAAALLVAVPAAMGLVGNTSFAQNVPVRVPPQATVVDDHGGQRPTRTTEPGDDHGGQRPASTPSSSGTGAGSGRQTPGGTSSVSGPGNISGKNGGPARDSGSGSGDTGGHGRSGITTGGRSDGPGHT